MDPGLGRSVRVAPPLAGYSPGMEEQEKEALLPEEKEVEALDPAWNDSQNNLPAALDEEGRDAELAAGEDYDPAGARPDGLASVPGTQLPGAAPRAQPEQREQPDAEQREDPREPGRKHRN